MTEILIICTANSCRSVLAQALLSEHLTRTGVSARIESAGLLAPGRAADPVVVSLLAGRGIDVSGHLSRYADARAVRQADLVITMAREHLRHAVVVAPQAWPRAFTLRDLVRRAEMAAPRPAAVPVAAWLDGLHQGRRRRDVLGSSSEDDIADPAGGPAAGYLATAGILDELLARLTVALWSGR